MVLPDAASEALLDAAARSRPEFERLVAGAPYEHKGILFSELLFLRALLGERVPRRIVESGRARGQSTLILGRLFPSCEVHSVELLRDTPDAPVAEARLAPLANVTLHYGDSRRLVPRLLGPGDVALIDGPKGYGAVRLALACLRRGAAWVFVHDCSRGSFERGFLGPQLPEALYSDDERFVGAHRDLDRVTWETCERENLSGWRPHAYDGRPQESYGPTLAALPLRAGRGYGRLILALRLARLRGRLGSRKRREARAVAPG